MRKLAIILVAVLVLLVGADRIGVYVAERTVADTVQSSQHLRQRPSVDIAGFPFLTQLLDRDLDEVTITVRDLPLGDAANAIRVSWIRAVMDDVKINFSVRRAVVGRGTATALITYAELSRYLGVTVRYAGAGKVRAAESVTVAGRRFDLGVTATPQLVDGALAFGGRATESGSGVPVSVLARVADRLGARIDLSRIPFGLDLQSLSADGVGITVRLAGRNITLQKQG
jgi:hypothetical protein